jgi:hypothetical protein
MAAPGTIMHDYTFHIGAMEKPFNVPYQLSIIALQPGMDLWRRKTFLTKTNPDKIPE